MTGKDVKTAEINQVDKRLKIVIPYQRIEMGGDSTSKLPLVKLKLTGPAGSLLISAVVDSGSEATLIPHSVMDILGLSAIGHQVYAGIGGIAETIVTQVDIEFRVDELTFLKIEKCKVVTLPENYQLMLVILGRDTIFEHFDIVFRKDSLELVAIYEIAIPQEATKSMDSTERVRQIGEIIDNRLSRKEKLQRLISEKPDSKEILNILGENPWILGHDYADLTRDNSLMREMQFSSPASRILFSAVQKICIIQINTISQSITRTDLNDFERDVDVIHAYLRTKQLDDVKLTGVLVANEFDNDTSEKRTRLSADDMLCRKWAELFEREDFPMERRFLEFLEDRFSPPGKFTQIGRWIRNRYEALPKMYWMKWTLFVVFSTIFLKVILVFILSLIAPEYVSPMLVITSFGIIAGLFTIYSVLKGQKKSRD